VSSCTNLGRNSRRAGSSRPFTLRRRRARAAVGRAPREGRSRRRKTRPQSRAGIESPTPGSGRSECEAASMAGRVESGVGVLGAPVLDWPSASMVLQRTAMLPAGPGARGSPHSPQSASPRPMGSPSGDSTWLEGSPRRGSPEGEPRRGERRVRRIAALVLFVLRWRKSWFWWVARVGVQK